MRVFSILFFLTGLAIVLLIQEFPWNARLADNHSTGLISLSLGLAAASCFVCSAFLFYKGMVHKSSNPSGKKD